MEDEEGFFFGSVPLTKYPAKMVVGLGRATECAADVRRVVDKVILIMIRHDDKKLEKLHRSLDHLHGVLMTLIGKIEKGEEMVNVADVFWSVCGVLSDLGYYAVLIQGEVRDLISRCDGLENDVSALKLESEKLKLESEKSKSNRELGDWASCFFRLVRADQIMSKLGDERFYHYPNHWTRPHHTKMARALTRKGIATTLFDFLWDFKKGRNQSSHGGAGGYLTLSNFEAQYIVDYPTVDTYGVFSINDKASLKECMNVVHRLLSARKNPRGQGSTGGSGGRDSFKQRLGSCVVAS